MEYGATVKQIDTAPGILGHDTGRVLEWNSPLCMTPVYYAHLLQHCSMLKMGKALLALGLQHFGRGLGFVVALP